MDFYYIGSDICRMESKKPCWLVRQFQRLFLDLHWGCVPNPEPVDPEELKRAEEEWNKFRATRAEREKEEIAKREEDIRNYCEKHGVNVDEYPSFLEAYYAAIKIDVASHKV